MSTPPTLNPLHRIESQHYPAEETPDNELELHTIGQEPPTLSAFLMSHISAYDVNMALARMYLSKILPYADSIKGRLYRPQSDSNSSDFDKACHLFIIAYGAHGAEARHKFEDIITFYIWYNKHLSSISRYWYRLSRYCDNDMYGKHILVIATVILLITGMAAGVIYSTSGYYPYVNPRNWITYSTGTNIIQVPSSVANLDNTIFNRVDIEYISTHHEFSLAADNTTLITAGCNEMAITICNLMNTSLTVFNYAQQLSCHYDEMRESGDCLWKSTDTIFDLSAQLSPNKCGSHTVWTYDNVLDVTYESNPIMDSTINTWKIGSISIEPDMSTNNETVYDALYVNMTVVNRCYVNTDWVAVMSPSVGIQRVTGEYYTPLYARAVFTLLLSSISAIIVYICNRYWNSEEKWHNRLEYDIDHGIILRYRLTRGDH